MQEKRLDPRVMTIWRQRALAVNVIGWLIVSTVFILSMIFNWPYFITWILAGLNVFQLVLYVFIFPPIRFRTFYYAIRKEDLLIQKGIFVISQTVIPFTRVQNVETEQGPLLRKHHLTSVSVTTAADTHEIPALDQTDAFALRDQISELIKENTIDEV